MVKLLLASLFTLACSTPKTSSSQPTTPQPTTPQPTTPQPTTPVAPAPNRPIPEHATCGNELLQDVLFQIDDVVTGFKPANNTTLAITRNGTWRSTTTRDGKPFKQSQGCVPAPDLASLKAALASATWKTSRAEVRCMAVAMGSTTYSYNNKPMLTSSMCDGQIIDEPTTKALADANAIVAKLRKA